MGRATAGAEAGLIRTDHYPLCWGCSPDVAGGLGFEWRIERGRVVGVHRFPERFQGAPGIAHGGLVAALLDEACGQVARLTISPSVTARLELRYLAPVPVEEPLRVGAEIVAAEDGRVTAEATVQDESGLVLAHARAECVRVRREHFLSTARGRAVGTDWLPP